MTNNGLPKILIFATNITFFQIYTILQTKSVSETDETKINDYDKSDQEKSDDQKLSTSEIEKLESDHMDNIWINPNEILSDKYIDSETEMEKTSGHV